MALTIRNNDIAHKESTIGTSVNIKEALEGDTYNFYGADAFILETLYILGQDSWTIIETTPSKDGSKMYKATQLSKAFEILRS